ncbi:MAG: biopolymer transporter ExbD, partial [Phycisphaerae bacterium]
LTSELILRMPELANGTQSQPVSLRADRRLSFGDVEPVVNACKAAGVTSLKLITTREGGGQ